MRSRAARPCAALAITLTIAALFAAAHAPALADAAPESLRVGKSSFAVQLRWLAGTPPALYTVYRATSPENVVAPANYYAVTTAEAFNDELAVAPGEIYFYKVEGPLSCNSSDACDNGVSCDGPESCSVPSGSGGTALGRVCLPGTPVACSDGDACSVEYCSWLTSSCASGPPDCDDGDPCTVDTCDAGIGCRYDFAQPIAADAELAGNELSAFPHFEFVTAFNANADVNVAVDVSRWPQVAGQTCDAYVVDDRSVQGWCRNRNLVDVRGAPRSVSFGSGSIADNVQRLARASTLPFAADGQLGVGYDVALDCDLDGQLGESELVDGLGDDAGMWVVRDLAGPGPLAVSQFDEIGPVGPACDLFVSGSNDDMRIYHPSILSSATNTDTFPLVVIGHGNGHCFDWYDWLGQHLASYGYIVMTHDNDTAPGIESASQSTLDFTDKILLEQATLGGGILDGHIDGDRIVWIGHSRGGEGVVRARDRLIDDGYAPLAFDAQDVVALVAIAPTDFLGPQGADPHDVPFQLLWGAADGDVCGCPNDTVGQSFLLYERATGERQATYVHGADHNDFNCCGLNDFSGPSGTEIGRLEAQQVAKASILGMLERRVRASVPAEDFLWRQYESFRPIGVDANTVVVNEYLPDAGRLSFVIDDYQAETAPTISSSGGVVTFTVSDLMEDKLRDTDQTYAWTGTDLTNGLTRARSNDFGRGVVFSYSGGDAIYELEIVPAERDFTDDTWLSFRAAQMPRHPETEAALEDLVFTVTLVDGSGATSSIRTDAYGGGIEEPYQRTGFGAGAGWQAELEVIRIRLDDFATDGAQIDMSDIAAIRFDLGVSHGSPEGRVSLDSIVLQQEDLCPADGAKSVPGICGCGSPDVDTDGDGTLDCLDTCTDTDGDGFGDPGFPANTCDVDLCPSDPGTSAPGACGCGVPETDTDADGTLDCLDTCTDTDGDGFGDPGFPANTCPLDDCPADATKTVPGVCGCGVPDTDTDTDGTADCADTCTDTDGDGFGDPGFPVNTCPQDECPADATKGVAGQCGCGVADTDTDVDGTADCVDACTDTDGDGFGDPGFPVNTCPQDECPADGTKGAAGQCGCGVPDTDTDADGTADCVDTCTDTDGDGFGNQGFPANTCFPDGCPEDPLKVIPGECGCGVADTDTDADGTADCVDTCTDTDGDGFGDPGFPANTCTEDQCPADGSKSVPGACGCGVPEGTC